MKFFETVQHAVIKKIVPFLFFDNCKNALFTGKKQKCLLSHSSFQDSNVNQVMSTDV